MKENLVFPSRYHIQFSMANGYHVGQQYFRIMESAWKAQVLHLLVLCLRVSKSDRCQKAPFFFNLLGDFCVQFCRYASLHLSLSLSATVRAQVPTGNIRSLICQMMLFPLSTPLWKEKMT